MSKESKKKRKLKKPESEKNDPLFKIPSVDPMCSLAIVGVVIAGLSLYYTRKSTLETQNVQCERQSQKSKKKNEVPVVQQERQGQQMGNILSFDDWTKKKFFENILKEFYLTSCLKFFIKFFKIL